MTDDGWDLIFEFAETFDEWTPPEVTARDPGAPASVPGDRPGDDFNRRARWEDVIGPYGWVLAGTSGEKAYWRRPGKDRGWSATTGHCRSALRGDLFYVFTSSAPPFEQDKAYSRFEAFALLNHGGDWAAAGKALADLGYGAQPPRIEFRARPAGQLGGVQNSVFTSVPHTENRIFQANGAVSPTEAVGGAEGEAALSFRRIPASQLRSVDSNTRWLWHGYLALNAVTLLSSLWKVGKTTLLAHLLRAMEEEGDFCDIRNRRARVLVVTEEHESVWADRRDLLGLHDHIDFIVRPFAMKPKRAEWVGFLIDLQKSLAAKPVDLLVVDTIVNLWPVEKENDASEVQAALMPLRAVAEDLAILLFHHLRKADGGEATGSRGSGALPAFVDIILEMRRYNAGDREDRRRVITGYGRYDETPNDLVIELSEGERDAGRRLITPPCYRNLGGKSDCVVREAATVLAGVLPVTPPGVTAEQAADSWPPDAGRTPTRKTLLDALRYGLEKGMWACSGEGRKGDPRLYWAPRKTT